MLVIRLRSGRRTLKTHRVASHFRTMDLEEVPHSRNGKHKLIVSMILRDLDQLKDGAALRVPLAELKDTKESVRSALNRAESRCSKIQTKCRDRHGRELPVRLERKRRMIGACFCVAYGFVSGMLVSVSDFTDTALGASFAKLFPCRVR